VRRLSKGFSLLIKFQSLFDWFGGRLIVAKLYRFRLPPEGLLEITCLGPGRCQCLDTPTIPLACQLARFLSQVHRLQSVPY